MAIDQLSALATAEDRDLLAALASRLTAARLRVLVAGEAKRGKSTLINALLGRDVLPTGVTPLTAVATTLTAGSPERIEVTFADGRVLELPLDSLADFGTERGNPGNGRDVSSITLWLDAPVLARGAEIVDTPGTGSVHAHNTVAADEVLPTMDAAIFVLSADPPVSASERDLLERVARLSVALFVVLNKADYLDDAGLAEALGFTSAVAAAATGRPQRIYAMSARTTGDPGLAAFASDLGAYLDTGRLTDLQRSVSGHVTRLAEGMLDELVLAQHAARLPESEAAEQLAAFGAQLAAVARRGAAAEDQVRGQERRLLAGLNAAAAQAEQWVTAQAAAAISELLHGDLAGASPAEIEQVGRDRLVSLSTGAVEEWRHQQAGELEAGLRLVDERCGTELEAELAAVRTMAADLLGVDLALPVPGSLLGSDRRFFYVVGEQVDQTELLAGAIRRRLPGGIGRKVARQHLLGEVAELSGALVGRARGDLQYRLAEAARALAADLRRRYAVSSQRLAEAMDRGARLRSSSAEVVGRELAELDQRERAIRAAAELAEAARQSDVSPIPQG
jgi:GTPase Era involved in 16S rRNA processing